MSTPSRGAGRIGVLVPYTNLNLEPDMGLLCPPGVSVHFARLGGYDLDAIPDENQMAGLGTESLDEPLRLLAGARPDVIAYGCTSATLTHGRSFDLELTERIGRDTGAAAVTAAGALIHALERLGVSRIGFASPYVPAINRQTVDFLASCGIETVATAQVTSDLSNYGQGELTPNEVFELGMRADASEAQAIVLVCTDMRSVEVIEQLEAETGKPVVTSNQAMAFMAAEIMGLGLSCPPVGRLLRMANTARSRA